MAIYKCLVCQEIFDEEPEDNICPVCFDQSVYASNNYYFEEEDSDGGY